MVIQSLLHWLFIFNQLLLRKRMLFHRISEGGVFMVVNSLACTSYMVGAVTCILVCDF